ncbi:MAG: hypothetical protein M3P24_03890 [Gemmatimonadota bacterium]|nr:hypothetical protein [Gemmatimonadota bacterium]
MTDIPKEPTGLPAPIQFPSLRLSERVRGSAILREHPPEYAQVLWESYRNVGDWAITDRVRRAELFGPGAAELRGRQLAAVASRVEKPVLAALETMRDLLASPGRMEPRVVARACRRLSAWAGERGAKVTQFYFAAAAGLCLSHDAKLAYQAGCLAREIAKWDAAEVWLEYAMAVARRRREREMQATAVLALGNTYYRQGIYEKAKEAQAAALVLAKRHRLREIEGKALHDLFTLFIVTNEHVKAEAFAGRALRAYGKEHPNVPGLAHDVAFYWLMRGRAARALRVLEVLAPRLQFVAHRVQALASTGRAAGLCGRREVFERVWTEFWSIKDHPDAQSRLAPALLELARGAACLGEPAHAEQAALAASEIAEIRGEIDVAHEAGEFLHQVRRGEVCRGYVPDVDRSGAPDRLANEFVEALQAGVDAV